VLIVYGTTFLPGNYNVDAGIGGQGGAGGVLLSGSGFSGNPGRPGANGIAGSFRAVPFQAQVFKRNS
jgi:hypothetical protein